jgi:Icc-related predicted phosphoesterase
MIIDCIADLHGHYPTLEGGDLLIVAGDLTARDTQDEWAEYFLWQGKLPYKKIVFVGGNHDNRLEKVDMLFYSPEGRVQYLCDSGTEFEGLKIWGSPWTLTFPGINPHCTAFTSTEEELEAKFAMIPDDIDILVTHGPPYGLMDEVDEVTKWGTKQFNAGSRSLLKKVFQIRPKLHVFGHIHEGYGKHDHVPREGSSEELGITPIKFVNCSHVNERYQPVNKPVRIVL